MVPRVPRLQGVEHDARILMWESVRRLDRRSAHLSVEIGSRLSAVPIALSDVGYRGVDQPKYAQCEFFVF